MGVIEISDGRMNRRQPFSSFSGTIRIELSENGCPKLIVSEKTTVQSLELECKLNHYPMATEPEQDVIFEIATCIAEIKDFATNTFSPPLGKQVDLDALEQLIQSSDTVCVTFAYEDIEVTVEHDGSVTATRSEEKSAQGN